MPFHYFWMPSLNGKLGRRWFWKVLTSHHDTCVALCVRVRVSVRVNVRARVCVFVPSWSVSHPHTHGQRKKCVVIITHMFGWRRKNERPSGNTSIIGQQRLQQKITFHQFLTLQRQFFPPNSRPRTKGTRVLWPTGIILHTGWAFNLKNQFCKSPFDDETWFKRFWCFEKKELAQLLWTLVWRFKCCSVSFVLEKKHQKENLTKEVFVVA